MEAQRARDKRRAANLERTIQTHEERKGAGRIRIKLQ